VLDYSLVEDVGQPAGGLLAFLEHMLDASVQRNEKTSYE
jgi:hypothetical protein